MIKEIKPKIRIGYRYFEKHRLSAGPMIRYSAFFIHPLGVIKRILLLDLRTNSDGLIEKATFNWTFYEVGEPTMLEFKMLSKRHSVSRGFMHLINSFLLESLTKCTVRMQTNPGYSKFYYLVFGEFPMMNQAMMSVNTIRRTMTNCLAHSANIDKPILFNRLTFPITIKLYSDVTNSIEVQTFSPFKQNKDISIIG